MALFTSGQKNFRHYENYVRDVTQNCVTCITCLRHLLVHILSVRLYSLPSSYMYISLYSQCPLEFLDVFLNLPYAGVVDGHIILYGKKNACVICMIVLHICVLSIDSTTVYECVYECLFVCNVFACISLRRALECVTYASMLESSPHLVK